MSIIGNFLGLNPSAPVAEQRKGKKSLGRLSLAQLSNRLRDLQAASDINLGDITSQRKSPTDILGITTPDIGKDLNLGGLGAKRVKSTPGVTTEQAQKRQQRKITGRLGKLGEAKRGLVSRVTGARTQRATQISTLLGRGI